jgi:hypothetical protein
MVRGGRATAYLHIPDRDTIDPITGETAVGLPGTKLALGAVNTPELADNAATAAKIADQAVGLLKISDGAKNPAQATSGLRSIGNFLGGSSVQSAAGDHSHGSGNSLDFDYLPEAARRRALRVRQYLRARKGEMLARSGTASERLVQVENRCEALTFMVLALARCLIDAPDLSAEERQQMRDAGETIEDFFEYRQFLARGRALEDEESSSSETNESFHDRSLPGYSSEHPDMGEWVSPVA